jgi:hypothetical protein
MRQSLSSVLALLAVGCTWVSQKHYEEVRDKLDQDKDGVPFAADCDDQDELRADNLPEVPYDAVDNDCSLEEDQDVDNADVDIDGDGYAGISEEDYLALADGVKRPLTYPAVYKGRPLDCDDGLEALSLSGNQVAAALQAAKLVNPGRLITDEVLYDGIDTNCDQKLDYDRDGDGYFANNDGAANAITQADVQAFVDRYAIPSAVVGTWGPGGNGPALPGDCEDGTDAIYPGATAQCDDGSERDCPYNGFDEDCDGTDDFDQDDDGHIPPGFADQWNQFNVRYLRTPPNKPDDDCADGPDVPDIDVGVEFRPKLTLAEAALVNPDVANDAYYDGVDSNCDRANDFDQDGDGYIEDVNVAARDQMATTWGLEDAGWYAGPAGDCDDLDDTFHPGINDTLWTDADEDCDGLVDSSHFNFGDGPLAASATDCPGGIGGKGDVCWEGPSNPELLFFDDSSFVVFVGAMKLESRPLLPLAQTELLAGAVIEIPLATAIGAADPDRIDGRSWLRVFPPGAPQILAPHIDLARDLTPGESPCTVTVGVGTVCDWVTIGGTAEGGDGELNAAVVYENGGSFSTQPQSRGKARDPLTVMDTDIAAYVDAGVDRGVSVECGPEILHGKLSSNPNSYQGDTLGGDVCFFYDQPAPPAEPLVEVCGGGTCQVAQFTLAGLTFTPRPDIDVTADDWVWGDREDGYTLLVDGAGDAWVRTDGSSTLIPVFEGESMRSFDLEVAGTVSWLAGLTTAGEVLLQMRDGATVETITLTAEDTSNPTYEATGVAIALGPDQVGVAVTREDLTASIPRRGSVGWSFFGLP